MSKLPSFIRTIWSKYLELRKRNPKLALLVAVLAIAVPIGSAYAVTLPYDPFEKYGKTLPWSELQDWTETKAMILTANEDFHLSNFGYKAQDFARGTDAWTMDTPVHVISDGVIETVNGGSGSDYFGGLGRHVIVDHGNGYKTRYSHLGLMVLTKADEGTTIRQGQEIGYIGDTGNVTGANLEFTFYRSSSATPVNAFDDGRPYTGEMKEDPWASHEWVSPVTSFNNRWTKYRSSTSIRPDDPDNPWDPPVIDPLDRYLKNYGYMFPSGMIAEPINAATGNFIHRNTDTDLKTQEGPEIKFERFYNAQNELIGPNGRGWSHSYNMRILAHPDQQYSVVFSDGRGETFQETDNDPTTFTATFTKVSEFGYGTLSRLGAEGDYKFVYTSPDKTTYTFNSDRDMSTVPSTPATNWGKVETITDASGKSITFAYSAAGNLSKISDSFDNYVDFIHSGSNLLTEIKDQAGRSVTYEYNFDGRLDKVKKSNGEAWTYVYDGQGRILTITDAEGKVFVNNKYDDEHRVIEQLDGMGQVVKIAYEKETILGIETGNTVTKFTDARNLTRTLVHNDKFYITAQKEANGDEVKYEYTDAGSLSKMTDAKGQSTIYERDGNGNLTKEIRPGGYSQQIEYNAQNLPVKITDPSGSTHMEYNAAGKLTKLTNQKGESMRYFYNAQNLLIKTIDLNGDTKEYVYNDRGLMTQESDSATGAFMKYEYDDAGNRTAVTDALGRTVRMEYNAFGKVTKITDARGFSMAYEYDKNGNLRKQTDEAGAVTTYEADANENITKVTYANGTTEAFTYDQNNNRLTTKDRNGNLTKYEYDDKNRPSKETNIDAAGTILAEKRHEYDSNNNRIKDFDANGHETKYEYDSSNRLIKVINALGGTYHFSFDEKGQMVAKKDFEGGITKYEYDELGRKTKETDPLGNQNTFGYDGKGNLVTKTDALGNVTTYFYNSQNKLVAVQNPRGFQATYEYDVLGRMAKQANFAGEITTFEYDPNDNLAKQIDEAGNVTVYEYEARNKLAKLVDQNGNPTKLEYDLVGQKIKQIDALNNITSYQYDANGNVLKFTGENGTSVQYRYDGLNRTVEEIDANGNKVLYTYDNIGNMISVTDKNGNVTKTEYDKLNRQVKVTDALNQSETYEYSASGQIKSITDKAGNVTKFELDVLGRPVKVINARGFSASVSYDALGRTVSKTDNKGQATSFEYDANGNKTKQIDRGGVEALYTYDSGDRKISTSVPSAGVTTSIEYNNVGRLVSRTDGDGGTVEYQYDAVGNVTSVKNPRGFVTVVEYDSLNRQVKVTDPNGGATQTQYDAVGRAIKQVDQNGHATLMEYDAVNNATKLTRANGVVTTFSYDKQGNMVSVTNGRGFTTTFSYDALHRQIATTFVDGSVISQKYDALGRVTEKTDAKGQSNKFEYDSIGNVLKEVDPIGAFNMYTYDANNNITQTIDKSGSLYSFAYDSRDQVITVTDPYSKNKIFSYDSLGRKSSEVNERGAVTKFEYDKRDNVIKMIDAHNSQKIMEYDANSNLSKVIDELGRTTGYVYDNIDRLAVTVNALAGQKKYTYDKVGNILAETDEEGNTTKYNYDPVYNKTTVTDALGHATKYAYDANNNVVKQTDANGHALSFAYDNRDRQSTKKLAGGEVFSYQYDRNNNLIKQTTPKGTDFTFDYDARNLLVQKVDPLGNTEKMEYDAMGRVVSSSDALSNKTQYQYDKLSRLVKVVDAMTFNTVYEYDEVGNLLKEINANNQPTAYEYDLLNRKTKEANQLNNAWVFEYNAVSSLVKEVDPKAQITEYAYDALNRNTLIDYGIANENVIFNYDKVGNIVKAAKGGLSQTYSYDKVYRITKAEDNRGKASSYGYDPVGNRTSITFPDNRVGTYAYNVNNQLAELSLTYNGDEVSVEDPQTLTTRFSYDANLNLVKQTNPNLTETVKTYDSADRLIDVANRRTNLEVTPTKVEDFVKYTYQLNANGDKVKETVVGLVDNFAQCENQEHNGQNGHKPGDCDKPNFELKSQIISIVRNYGYDPLNRLVKVTNNSTRDGEEFLGYTENYSYDNVGNRTAYEQANAQTGAINKTVYSYNAANQLTADTIYDYSYDANGNRLSKTKKPTGEKNDKTEFYKFGYNKADQLVNVESINESSTIYNGNSEVVKDYITYKFDYQYDAFGRRTAKVNNTDYSICKGNGEHQDDQNWYDCNDGSGNDSNPPNPNVRRIIDSVQYYGISRVDYFYDGQTWEALSEYYDRLPPPEDPKRNEKPPVTDYFDLHTNYYKAGKTVIAAEHIAERAIPPLDLCKGNGEQFDDENWYDCNDGTGNDNKPLKPYTGVITPKTNQLLSYYHYDGLDSIVANTNYTPSYDVKNGVIDPTPILDTPRVYNFNSFEAYGKMGQFAFDFPGTPKKDYYEPSYPYAYGFEDWTTKSYTTKEFDVESSNYYYGSRYYDSNNGTWNKLDTYRGETKDPMSRHRYMFVNDNPVNGIDDYGFYDRQYIGDGKSDGLVNENYDYYEERIQYNTDQAVYHEGEVGRLNGIIPGLQATMNKAWWSMYAAKVTFHDYTQMNGVVGRLAARGYPMDYAKVSSYLGAETAKKGQVYAVKTTQYRVASSNYYGAVAQRDWHSGMAVYHHGQVKAFEQERVEFDSWIHDMSDAYNKTYNYGKDSFGASKTGDDYKNLYTDFFNQNNGDALYDGFNKYLARHMDNPEEAGNFFSEIFTTNIDKGLGDAQNAYIDEMKRQQAEQERNQGIFKIVVGVLAVAGGVACAVVTAGVGAAACAVGAALAFAAVVGETVVTLDNQQIMDKGEGFLSEGVHDAIRTVSDIGLVAGMTLIGGGWAVGLAAPSITTLSQLSGSLMAAGTFESFGMGMFTLGMTSYGIVGCGNRTSTNSECGVTDYAMLGVSAVTGFTMVGASAAAAQAYVTYNATSNTQTPYQKGQEGVSLSEQKAIQNGQTPTGKEVTFDVYNKDGTFVSRTRTDLVTTSKDSNTLNLIESKNGPYASLTTNQKSAFDAINKGGYVVPTGQNATQAGLEPGKAYSDIKVTIDWW